MNLVDRYPNYVTFNDGTICKAVREKLGITANKNVCVPLKQLNMVKELIIDRRGFDYFPDIKLLRNLERLQLTRCDIPDIKCITEMHNLKELTIAECDIENIDVFRKFTQIKSLDLSINCISDISPISDLKQLERLNLQFNLIEDISPLQSLWRLKELYLSGNCNLQNINPLLNMPNLKLITLHDIGRKKNIKIRDLRKAIKQNGGDCKILTTLDAIQIQ